MLIRLLKSDLMHTAVLFASLGAPGTLSSQTLASPVKQVAGGGLFSSHRSWPTAAGGYLIAYTPLVKSTAQQAIFMVQTANSQQSSATFWLPSASEIRIADVTVLNGGMLAVVGTSITSSGSPLNFLATMSMAGASVSYHDLGNYFPEHICAAPDQSLWLLGQAPDNSSYPLLRNYNTAGTMLRSYIDSMNVNSVSLNMHPHTPRQNVAFLSCGDKSVGLYLGTPGLWSEIDYPSGSLSQWRVLSPSSSRMSGLVLFGTNMVVAGFKTRQGATTPAQRQLYKLVFNPRSTATWAPVNTSALSGQATGQFAALVGRESGELIYTTDLPTASQGNANLFWSSIQ